MFLVGNLESKKHAIVQIFRCAIICAFLSLVLSLCFPLEYRAQTQVLVLPKHTNTDPYVSLKSAERSSDSLTHIIKTESFYTRIMEKKTIFSLNTEQFENISEQKKRKRWKKLVSGSIVYGTGIIQIDTHHRDKEQAKAYGKAISDTLVKDAHLYTGGAVMIKEISTPLVSRFPVRPHFFLNALLGALLGVVGMVVWQKRKDMRIVL